jgi:DNA-binding response OmpR family regulator
MTQATRQRQSIDLNGLTVLVVEDNYYLANEICATLRLQGATIAGPTSNIEHALDLLATTKLDCAVLDINLHGEFSFELAEELRRRRVPLIFTTGYDKTILPAPFLDAVRLEKPVDLDALLRAVSTITAAAALPPVV